MFFSIKNNLNKHASSLFSSFISNNNNLFKTSTKSTIITIQQFDKNTKMNNKNNNKNLFSSININHLEYFINNNSYRWFYSTYNNNNNNNNQSHLKNFNNRFCRSHQTNYNCKKSMTTRTASSSHRNHNISNSNNVLNINKTKKLMRLIYSRVHPDLFTNYLQAQKQNEHSLKLLRNVIDLYTNSVSNPTQYNQSYAKFNQLKKSNLNNENDLIFYVKEPNNENLRKILIKNVFALNTSISIQILVENLFNQFIQHLNIPMDKFTSTMTSSSSYKSSLSSESINNNSIKVTFRHMTNFDYDDDYIDFDEFERWCNLNMNQNKIPSLDTWLENNKTIINNNLTEARKMQALIEKNKILLIQKWKLKNVIFKSHWSLKHFNSYLLALNSANVSKDTHFQGFTLVLTNSNLPGLRKNGQVHLNCGQVYQEWLDILAISKKNEGILEEIVLMEDNLSKLLRNIKVCDAFDEFTFDKNLGDESIVKLASFYHQMLNNLLTNLTSHLKPNETIDDLLKLNNFSNLQLTVQNVNKHYLNEAGQFVIGPSTRINLDNTIDFINKNKNKSIQLYKEYIRSMENILNLKQKIEITLKSNISFDSSLSLSQKLETLKKMNDFFKSNSPNSKKVLSILNGININIGTYYCLNDNGSIQIPWNWFQN